MSRAKKFVFGGVALLLSCTAIAQAAYDSYSVERLEPWHREISQSVKGMEYYSQHPEVQESLTKEQQALSDLGANLEVSKLHNYQYFQIMKQVHSAIKTKAEEKELSALLGQADLLLAEIDADEYSRKILFNETTKYLKELISAVKVAQAEEEEAFIVETNASLDKIRSDLKASMKNLNGASKSLQEASESGRKSSEASKKLIKAIR